MVSFVLGMMTGGVYGVIVMCLMQMAGSDK